MKASEFGQLHVSEEDDGRRLVVRLDHGKVNACGSAVIADFELLAKAVKDNKDLRCVVVHSSKVTKSGKAIFVAGADVTERVGWTDDDVIAHVRRQRQALLALRRVPVFTIVVVDGLALGLGTELMLAFDYRIASPNAAFALPETGLGIIPGALGSSLLSSVIGPNQALRMGCTGERVGAEEANRIGLVDELQASPEAAFERATKLALHISKKAPRAIAAYKNSVLQGSSLALDARLALERENYEGQVRNGDAAVGRASFKDIREGRSPAWPTR